MEVSGHLQAVAALTSGDLRHYLLNRKLCVCVWGGQSWSGLFGEGKDLFPRSGIDLDSSFAST